MSQLTIVMFSTSTCQHCKPMKQTLEELQAQFGDEKVFLKIWVVDKQPAGMEVAREWQVKGVPTTVFLREGQALGELIGAQSKEDVEKLIERCLQPDVFQEPSGRKSSTCDSVLRDTGESEDVPTTSN